MEGVQVHVGIGGSATRCPLFCVSRQFPAADVLVSYGRETAAPSALPAASGLCKVTAIVPEDRAEGLRQCAGELYARRQNGTGPVAPQWRRLSPSAELMVDPGCGARCAIRDTGAPGERRYHWTVTVFDETDPVAAGGALRSLRRHDRGQRAGRVAVHSLTLCLFCRRIETQCPIREGAAEDGRVTLDAAPLGSAGTDHCQPRGLRGERLRWLLPVSSVELDQISGDALLRSSDPAWHRGAFQERGDPQTKTDRNAQDAAA